ncbi:hypothetical protein EDC04DRAFT_2606493 [Pisolithus marmoratus]|nr:hypothetical protein EDC04DRAFT_2606493 [Pisolithus marmoratus]
MGSQLTSWPPLRPWLLFCLCVGRFPQSSSCGKADWFSVTMIIFGTVYAYLDIPPPISSPRLIDKAFKAFTITLIQALGIPYKVRLKVLIERSFVHKLRKLKVPTCLEWMPGFRVIFSDGLGTCIMMRVIESGERFQDHRMATLWDNGTCAGMIPKTCSWQHQLRINCAVLKSGGPFNRCEVFQGNINI